MRTVICFDGHDLRKCIRRWIGHLNQDQFISGVQRSIPPQELQQLLRFEIIPSQLLSDVDNLPSLPSPSTSSRRPNDTDTGDFISDNQLRQIAGQAARRDWESLAIKLGFLEYDIESFKVQNDSDPAATVWNDQVQLCSTNVTDFYSDVCTASNMAWAGHFSIEETTTSTILTTDWISRSGFTCQIICFNPFSIRTIAVASSITRVITVISFPFFGLPVCTDFRTLVNTRFYQYNERSSTRTSCTVIEVSVWDFYSKNLF